MDNKENKDGTQRPWIFLGVALITIMGALALWRVTAERPAPAPLPADPAARAMLFRKHLRENPIKANPEKRKPIRDEWERWLAEHEAEAATPDESGEASPESPPQDTPPPVFDFGTANLPRAPENPEPARIEPNEYLDEEDLRHPEIFFELAEQIPEYNTLETQLDVHRFFKQYRDQLDGDLAALIRQGGDPETIAETRAAITRYDDAIEKMEDLIARQPGSRVERSVR